LKREIFNERISDLANVACLAYYGQSINILLAGITGDVSGDRAVKTGKDSVA
jgi:hypothetical protein